MKVLLNNGTLSVDFVSREVVSLVLNGMERISGRCPIFRLRLRDRSGEAFILTAYDAKNVTLTENGAIYTDFCLSEMNTVSSLRVSVSLLSRNGEAEWRISVLPADDSVFVEWVDYPLVSLTKLRSDCSTGGQVLLPYNEGVVISDWGLRQSSIYGYTDAEYPSQGSYMIFPNMMFAQMEAYLWDDVGLYIGAHDSARGVKGIDFYQNDDGAQMRIRLYCGVDFG